MTDAALPLELQVFDPRHQPHLVMVLRLTQDSLQIEPSEAMRAYLAHDLRASHEEASHIPILGWLLDRAITFAEHRVIDLFGTYDLHQVRMHTTGSLTRLTFSHTVMDLGPGEVDSDQATHFVATFEALRGAPGR